ncbi:MAG: hypothetical protein JWR83_1317 [Aeromicrobium sp.]|nr:hypothetical protein [Aeromicrobium sp.]
MSDVHRGEVSSRMPGLPDWTVAASVAVAVASRLPFIGHAAGPDEAGFLIVGRQWHGAGTSLYGNYWVDRPPLLITIFRIAASTGGLTALRLIGCLAVAALILGCVRVTHLMAGVQAARWAAITASALSISLVSYEVNGELLAAPFVVGGIAAVIAALQATDVRRVVTLAGAAGACAMSALLIKQNFADVAVFGAAAYLIAGLRHEISRRRLLHLVAGSTAGAAVALVLVGAWTAWHGTSLSGVFDAMYPFRIKAGNVMAAAGRQHATVRLNELLFAALRTGLVIVLLFVASHVVSKRRPTATVWWALLVTIGFGGVSVFLGGNYWLHYLVELIGPAAIVLAVLIARRARGARAVLTYVVVAAALAWGVVLAAPQGDQGRLVGRAVAASAQPGDTIFTAYGHANVVGASGLDSPYPYLWSLPIKTLDPQLTALNAVLQSPQAPTYFVTWNAVTSWGLDTATTSELLARDYRPLASICGHTIYLRNGVERTAPPAPTRCSFTSPALKVLKEYVP